MTRGSIAVTVTALTALCLANGLLGNAAAAGTVVVAKEGAVAAPAAGAAADVAPAVTAPAAPSVPVMIVLDASGSMNQTDAPGPRINAAKAAVTNLIDTLPADTNVGLQVYGTSTGSTDAEKTAGCTDIKTLAPVAPLDPAALKAQIAAVTANGYTPIGNALRAAADALPTEGPRSIVLVSDGEDTCAPPAPCDVAKELKQQGVDLIVHTVGFKVDPTAREQLTCIADATGGTYSDADDATTLNDALKVKVDYAITGYTPQGTPVTGADQPSEQAPLLSPGQYLDTFSHGYAVGDDMGTSGHGTTKYYTIPVKVGVTPYITATIVPPTDLSQQHFTGALGVDLTLLAKDLTTCADIRGFTTSSDRRLAPTGVLKGAAIGSPGHTEQCSADGVQILRVERFGEAWTDQQLTAEITVRMEPPADASAVPPAATDPGPALPAPTNAAASPVTGGHSFNDAPQLTSGATYSDTLVTGDSLFYRIPLHWGQRFSYLITPTGQGNPVLKDSSAAWVTVFNPVREIANMPPDADTGRSWFVERTDDPFSSATRYPVRYTNRGHGSSDSYALDGDYYLRLDADVPPADDTSAQAFLITVVVSGDVEPGPVYLPVTDSGTAASTTAIRTTAASTNESTASISTADSAATSTTAASNQGATAPSANDAVANTASGSATWIYLIVGLLAVAAVLAVVVLRRNRASKLPAGPPHS